MAEVLPLIAIVIPTLNEERFLPRCLTALNGLDYPVDRRFVLVVDNHSTDRTPDIARSHGASLIEAEKRTIGYSRNTGAFARRADLIAFLDADCLADRAWLRRAAQNFEVPGVVAAGSYPSVLAGESNALQRAWAALCRRENSGVHRVDWLPTANLVVRADRFEAIGGFNETLTTCEDVDLGYRLSARGAVVYDDGMIVYHLREPASFRAFFKKEVWHAKNNVTGSLSHGLRLSELPSLLAPIAFASAWLLALIGALWSPALLAGGLLTAALIPGLYTLRGLRWCRNFPLVLAIYFVYFAARAYASLGELIHLLVRRLHRHLGAVGSRE
jgi:glycosyltransferase involved in cell wall biosynthesis